MQLNLIKIRRSVERATRAACRSTYKPRGGRPYEDCYPHSDCAFTYFAAMRAAQDQVHLAMIPDASRTLEFHLLPVRT